MKIKVLALILAILCISMAVVGCSGACTEHIDENKDGKCDKCEAPTACASHIDADGNMVCDVCGANVTPPCELHVDADANLLCDVCGTAVDPVCNPHKDTNADHLCDVCGGAIVVVTEQVAPKEEVRVPMVVNTAPAEAALSTYVHTELWRETAASVFSVGKAEYHHQKYYLFQTVEGENTKYEVKNLATNGVVYSVTLPTTTVVSVNLENDYIFVSIIGDPNNEYIYLSYAGEVLYQKQASALEAPTAVPSDFGGYTQLTIEGKAFLFDPDTDAVLLRNADPSTVLARPTFVEKTEHFGIAEVIDPMYATVRTLYVYDRSVWLNCIMSYDVPGYWQSVQWFMLENGNLVVQGQLPLADDAVSYDVLEGGSKFDIVNVLIDPTAKTVTEIEFGYVLADTEPAKSNQAYQYTEATPNVVYVYPIVADRIDWNNEKVLLTDNALKVLYDMDNVFAGRSFVALGNGLFRVEEPVTGAYEILNAAGERISLSMSPMLSGLVSFRDGVWYDLRGNGITSVADGAEVVDQGYNAMGSASYTLFKITDPGNAAVSYWYYGGTGLVQIALADIVDIVTTEYGFVVTHMVEGAQKYTLFNTAGTAVCELVDVPNDMFYTQIDEKRAIFECYDMLLGVDITYVIQF